MLNDALNDALFLHELQNNDVMLLQEAVSLNNKCTEGTIVQSWTISKGRMLLTANTQHLHCDFLEGGNTSNVLEHLLTHEISGAPSWHSSYLMPCQVLILFNTVSDFIYYNNMFNSMFSSQTLSVHLCSQ